MKQGNNDRLKGKKTLKVAGFLQEWAKDDVKKKVDIIKLFASFDVALTKKGKNFTGLCPWHDDENPSLSVDQQKGLYNCFGCGESGDVVTLVQKMKGIGFQEAMEYLKKQNGTFAFKQENQTEHELSLEQVSLSPEPPEEIKAVNTTEKTPEDQAAPPIIKRKKERKADLESKDSVTAIEDTGTQKLLKAVINHYNSSLLTDKKALSYLKKRGLNDPDLVKTYQIGCCNNTLIKRLSQQQIKVLKEKGIINQYGKEHFSNCLVFPVFKESGEIGEIYGRRITDREPKHLYLPGKHEGIFNHKSLKAYDEIILSEGIIDALSLIKAGFKNIIPLYGTNGFTDDHAEALKNNLVKKVIIAFDNDDPGAKAAENLKEKLLSIGLSVSFLFPPSGKDWNEYLTAGGTKNQIKTLIEATDVYEPEKSKPAYKYQKKDSEHIFDFDQVCIRLSGLKEDASLRVRIRITYQNKSHFDSLDLYNASRRTSFINQSVSKLSLRNDELENYLTQVIDKLEAIARKKSYAEHDRKGRKKRELTQHEQELGIQLLSDPRLIETVRLHLTKAGCVGERANKVLLYLLALSRRRTSPLSAYVMGRSSGGKTWLVKQVAMFTPKAENLFINSASEQAFYYTGDDLRGMLVILGEFEGAENIEKDLRQLISDGKISRLVTQKDAEMGDSRAKAIEARGPLSFISTTTNPDVNPENLSRCLILHADENEEQTKRIYEYQKFLRSKQGYSLKKEIEMIIEQHQAAGELLEDIEIFNPFEKYIDFPTLILKGRRVFINFLNVIEMVTYLYQKQREVRYLDHEGEKISYIESTLDDYRIAYELVMDGVLENSLDDMPRQAKEFHSLLEQKRDKIAGETKTDPDSVLFTRVSMHELIGYPVKQVRKWTEKLLEYEYLEIVKGFCNGETHRYRVLGMSDFIKKQLEKIPAVERIKKQMEDDKRNGNEGTLPFWDKWT